ncbi:protein transport protein Sec24A [Lingula anatina]|uniref:Protein transport protein Sec24A n=1 Tax=Lingula anatina TaxID=7574 RepID=A0A1S3KIE7_LINAN|nr:protein transport protein Sec24A [Lingula anatina]|eukprot:XP_013421986.1 protein transport protein Sec24A [Lingula anatina]
MDSLHLSKFKVMDSLHLSKVKDMDSLHLSKVKDMDSLPFSPQDRGLVSHPPPTGPGIMGGPYTQQPHGGFTPGSTPGYPQPQGQTGQMGNSMPYGDGLNSSFGKLNFQSPESRVVNLLQERNVIPPDGVETVKPNLAPDFKKLNCSPDIFRCTLTTIPQSQSLLNKARLPLGILIHPFKDLTQLPVIQSSVIVRCRSCRTYINPFVAFIDNRRWKCNLCYRINEAPEEFQYDPVSKTFGDPMRRPEMKSATIEFIASSEYMLRPPQPAVYLFLLDVSFNAISTGYLSSFCQILDDELDRIPGDARTLVGFITYDSSLYFFNLSEGLSAPQLLVVSDIEDVFLPMPDGLLTNLRDCKDLVKDLLSQLPKMFEGNKETNSALGAAMQAGLKMMTATGGRISVFQTCLPSVGPGSLQAREDPNARAGKAVAHLGPATDFYKKYALDCSAQQIAVDIFFLNGQYADITSIACASKFSGGDLHYYPMLHSVANPAEVERFENDLRRYLTRKIGFESVMRVRCTKGLSIHTFHGNFFVRSTDLLSLPNINPDAGFGMQVSIEDNLHESSTVSFQAALLYTSSKGERRIRVHNLCLPVTNQLTDVFSGADQQAIAGLLAKMAVDRSLSSSLMDAREAMVNACMDAISAYASSIPASQRIGTLPCCYSIRLLPMYTLALLKSAAFRVGVSTKLDDRVFFMEMCKSLPLNYILLKLYPSMYPVHNLEDKNSISKDDQMIPQPPHLQLSSANLDRQGVFLLDAGDEMFLYVGGAVSDLFCQEVLDKPNFLSVPDGMTDLPELENPTSERLRNFINYLQDQRPFHSKFLVVREDSKARMQFFKYMVEDKTEASMSYYEYLQSIQKQLKG